MTTRLQLTESDIREAIAEWVERKGYRVKEDRKSVV